MQYNYPQLMVDDGQYVLHASLKFSFQQSVVTMTMALFLLLQSCCSVTANDWVSLDKT